MSKGSLRRDMCPVYRLKMSVVAPNLPLFLFAPIKTTIVLSQTEIHTLNYISWKLIRKQAPKQTSAKRIYRFPYPCIKVDAKIPFSNLAK